MTGPMTFDPIPFPVLEDECDGVAAFTDVSNVGATNFDRLRGFFGAPPVRYLTYRSTQVSNFDPLPAGSRTWSSLSAAQFPPLSFTVPAKCQAVLVSFTAQVASVASAGPWVEFGFDYGGTGVGTKPARLSLYIRGMLMRSTRSYLMLPANLVAGGTLTLTPGLAYDQSPGQLMQALGGSIEALVFTGA